MSAGQPRLPGVIFNRAMPMQVAGELAQHITQSSIAMVSLPALVAGLQEAACLLEEKH